MNVLQIIGLLALIVVAAGLLGYYFQSGENQPVEESTPDSTYTQEELENIKLAEELYDKDLRTETPQPTTEIKAEDIAITEPELIAKQFTPDGIVTNVSTFEVISTDPEIIPVDQPSESTTVPSEKPKPESPVEKPKKKRKYYPKKK